MFIFLLLDFHCDSHSSKSEALKIYEEVLCGLATKWNKPKKQNELNECTTLRFIISFMDSFETQKHQHIHKHTISSDFEAHVICVHMCMCMNEIYYTYII